MELEVSAVRWWVLAVFTLAGVTQSMLWNIFSPIDDCLRGAYGKDVFSDEFITWSANTANIAFLIAVYPTALGVKYCGPRIVMLGSVGFLVACAGLRCIPCQGSTLEAIMIASMALNGLSGTWFAFGAPILSEIWFPAEQRTLATAVGSIAPYLGSAMGFVMGPATVGSDTSGGSSPSCETESAIRRLFIVELALACAVLLAILVHFPDSPVRCPTVAAARKRAGHSLEYQVKDYSEEQLQRNGMWLVSLCLGVPLGIHQGWTAVLYLNLEGTFTEDEAGWLGFYMVLSGCVGSVLIGAMVDRFTGSLKQMAVLLMWLSTVFLCLFVLAVSGTLSLSTDTVHGLAYASAILGGLFFYSTIPLYFEMLMELVYGYCSETMASALAVAVTAVVQIALLALPTKINGDGLWMNWVVCITFTCSAIVTMFVKMRYVRSSFDSSQKSLGKEDVPNL